MDDKDVKQEGEQSQTGTEVPEQQAGDHVTESKTFDLGQVVERARMVITNPGGFYQQMPRSGGFANPTIFVAVMALATGVLAAVLSIFSSGVGPMGVGLAAIIIYPIFAVIGAFIAAAVLFVIWKLMGSEQDYETAFRCWSSATALYPIAVILSLIPYLGALVGVAWGTWLMIEASVAVHQRTRRTATIVFGILGLLAAFSNVSSEYAARQMADRMSDFSSNYENMSPEDAGRQMGEFLKGLEDAANKEEQGN